MLFLSDIFPTGYMGADMCNIKPGDTIAVWGCGPVGQFAMKSAYLLGAERVIGIDRIPERLAMAKEKAGAETINYEECDIYEALREMTGGRGPDCLYRRGRHGIARAWTDVRLRSGEAGHDARIGSSDRSAAGDHGVPERRYGVGHRCVWRIHRQVPDGSVMNRSLTIRTGQCHVQKYMKPLLERIQKGEIDPSFVITHTLPLDQAPEGFEMFNDKNDYCIKIVLKPQIH